MRRLRRRQLRYGLFSGVIAFAAGWAIVAIRAGSQLFPNTPRWQSTLWVWLGFNRVELSASKLGGLSIEVIQPASAASLPDVFWYLTFPLVGLASAYTCYQIQARSISNNVSNVMNVGGGYFLAGLLAMFASDIQPAISTIVGLAVFSGAALWIGSSVLGLFATGIPVIGVASVGGIAAIGILVLLGGIAVAEAVWWLAVAAFGTAAAVGTIVGTSRQLRRKGRHNSERFYRVQGLKMVLENHWLEIILVAAVAVGLIFGLQR